MTILTKVRNIKKIMNYTDLLSFIAEAFSNFNCSNRWIVLISVANNVPRHRRLRVPLSCRLIYIFLCVCIYISVCMSTYMYVRLGVCMSACMYAVCVCILCWNLFRWRRSWRSNSFGALLMTNQESDMIKMCQGELIKCCLYSGNRV